MKDGHAVLFNHNWKFLLDCTPGGTPVDASRADYPDRTWKRLDLPHDWVISRPFEQGAETNWPSMQGFFAWEGVCWYRKTFSLPDMAGKEAWLYFGGAYRDSKIFINGREAGGRVYGYSSFEIDITPYVIEGNNCVAVRLDNRCKPPDRWYAGSGLYRNVYLRIVPLVHIKTWGVRVRTRIEGLDRPGGPDRAELTIETTVVNSGITAGGTAAGGMTAGGTVRIRVLGPDGAIAAEAAAAFQAAGAEITLEQRLILDKPRLWSAESPQLYRALVCLDIPGTEAGTNRAMEVPFGIRHIEIGYKTGMQVNGNPVKLKGVNLHQECGILGTAWYEAAWRRRLLSLKSIGCNAIRTSHNPPAEEFLDLCDELGFYVLDECFDKWKSGCYGACFDAQWQRDLGDFILRDRNHPSVFLWSIGNEVEDQGSDAMREIQRRLAAFIRSLDDRPITCALEPHVHPRSLIGAPVAELVEHTRKLAEDVDVLGLNYHEALYAAYTAGIERPILGAECYEYYSSTASNYEDIVTKNPWRFVLENDNVIGQFIWAGVDYLGESSWPAKAWTGAMLDICGFMKPSAYFRKSLWSSEPMVYISLYDTGLKNNYTRGRWSFPPTASQLNLDHFRHSAVKAAVYSNCEEVELRINGKPMGRRRPGDFENGLIEWTFEYAEGEITVSGYRKGREVCSHSLKTAGEARLIRLEADRRALRASGPLGGPDLAHVTVTITDEGGVLCPNAELLVEFGLRGDGEILGACSPDITGNLGYQLPKTYTSG
ncbi:MAG: DUF4982 domain-containing protein, partial [Treponema sp.]|nr:DUF4982 domain-containing protein [Treponema sp.]